MLLTDSEYGIDVLLGFNPCYLKSNGHNIHYCEFRAGTFGTMVSSAICGFLALMFSLWAIRRFRDPRYTWGAYYFAALCHFIACMFTSNLLSWLR
jgi:hypothetical protein